VAGRHLDDGAGGEAGARHAQAVLEDGAKRVEAGAVPGGGPFLDLAAGVGVERHGEPERHQLALERARALEGLHARGEAARDGVAQEDVEPVGGGSLDGPPAREAAALLEGRLPGLVLKGRVGAAGEEELDD
jgi:hypothetical protein